MDEGCNPIPARRWHLYPEEFSELAFRDLTTCQALLIKRRARWVTDGPCS